MNTNWNRSTWALDARIEDPTIWRTLVVLTEMTNEAGLCWPKVELLAERVMRSERTVRNALDALVDGGYLERHRRRTSGKLRGYLFRICAPGLEPVTEDTCPMWLTQGEFDSLPSHWRAASTGNELHPSTGNRLPVDQRQPVAGQELTHRSEPPRSKELGTATADAAASPQLRLVADEGPEPEPRQVAASASEAENRQGQGDPEPEPSWSPDVVALTGEFTQMVLDNGHTLPRSQDGWLKAMDALLRLGPPGNGQHPPSPDEVREVMRWTLTVSDFWPANVRSVPTFRKKFTQLRAQMARSRKPAPSKYQDPVNYLLGNTGGGTYR